MTREACRDFDLSGTLYTYVMVCSHCDPENRRQDNRDYKKVVAAYDDSYEDEPRLRLLLSCGHVYYRSGGYETAAEFDPLRIRLQHCWQCCTCRYNEEAAHEGL